MLVIRPSHSDRWILTTAIGGSYYDRWNRDFRPSWVRYAERYDLGIVVVTADIFGPTEPRRHGAWQKLLGPRALREFLGRDVRCLLLDSDVIISPGAPNVFDRCPPHSLGVVSQEYGVPLGGAQPLRRQMAFLRKSFMDDNFPLRSSLIATPAKVAELGGFPPLSNYFCSGVVMTNTSRHANLFSRWYSEAPCTSDYRSIDWGEELWMNVKVANIDDVVWMGYEWQALWAFEVAANYPFLYAAPKNEELSSWILAAVLLNNHFLHLAGSWESTLFHSSSPTLPSIEDFESFTLALTKWKTSTTAATDFGVVTPPQASHDPQEKSTGN